MVSSGRSRGSVAPSARGRGSVLRPTPGTPAAVPGWPATPPRRVASALVAGVAELPSLVVVAVAVVALVGTASALAGWRPISSQAASLGVVALVVACGVLVVRPSVRRRTEPPPVLALVPAAYLLLVGLALAWWPGDGLGWFLGGDHVRHLLYSARLEAVGHLSYATDGYPRGWHSLMATLWSASGSQLDGPGVGRLIGLMAALAWLLPVLVSAETGLLASTVARRCGLGGRTPAVAGLVAASGVGIPTVLANYQSLGFETSWLAALVLAVSARAAVAPDTGLRPVVLGAAGVVTMSHTWQLLLPATGLALLVVTWGAWRRRPDGRGRVVGIWLLAGLVSLPGVLGVLVQVGLNHATDADVEVPIPSATLVAGLVATALLVAGPGGWSRGRRSSDGVILGRDGRLAALGVMVLLPGLTALGIAVRLGIPVTDYYPSKLVWHTAVLGLAAVGVVVGAAGAWLWERTEPLAAVVRVLVGALVVGSAVLLALTPVGAVVGAWSTGDGRVIVRAVTADEAGSAQVAWFGDAGNDTITRVLLDVYRPGEPLGPQEPLDVARECDLLRRAPRPAVLSDRSVPEVRARYACVPAVQVVPVSNPQPGR